MKKHLYFENLDGLRFLCFLSVFFYHSFHTEHLEIKQRASYHFIKYGLFGNGNIGVNFFFVLSGFLITMLLIKEKQLNGQLNIFKFWLRRVLRIWPLYYFCVFFGFVIFPLIKQHFGMTSNETADPLLFITFTSNFNGILHGTPDSSVLGVLWSVAIEEQFYLVWPIVLFIFPIKNLWLPFLLIILSSLIFRAVNDSYELNEVHTLSCIGDMAIGGLGAWLIVVSNKFRDHITAFSKIQITAIYVSFILLFLFRDKLYDQYYLFRVFERMIISIIAVLIILEQTYASHSLFKLSKFKTISSLGNISYGLYCLHFIGILAAITITKKLHFNNHLWQVIISDTILALGFTIIISKLSYKYFETPFLRLKEKFAYITKQ